MGKFDRLGGRETFKCAGWMCFVEMLPGSFLEGAEGMIRETNMKLLEELLAKSLCREQK